VSRVAPASSRRVRHAAEVVDSLAARARGHDPARALARGWSITRDAEGSLVRSTEALEPGSRTTTTVAGGAFSATVDTVTSDGVRSTPTPNSTTTPAVERP
jgi:exodeoxyribonuclease VII large subunit